jgi:hypothetical protein
MRTAQGQKRARFASGLPFSEAERQHCANLRAEVLAKRNARRKACPSGQHYDQKPTPETRARDQRIMGEFEDAS